MKRRTRIQWMGAAILLSALVVLNGCDSDDDAGMTPAQEATYRVTMTNLTGSQPLSPLGVVIHTGGYAGWEIGKAASSGLERLAEGGDPAAFLAEAAGNADVLVTGSGSGVIGPGATDNVSLATAPSQGLQLTCATMLVNTNDAFTGISGLVIGDLAVGERKRIYAHPYDAGTEGNTETASTIPGPAGGGEGFNAERTDRDFVSAHSGVVTQDDGLATSGLDESHRFLSPVAEIVVTRIR